MSIVNMDKTSDLYKELSNENKYTVPFSSTTYSPDICITKEECSICHKLFTKVTLNKHNGICGRCFNKNNVSNTNDQKEVTEINNQKEVTGINNQKEVIQKHVRKTIPKQLRFRVWEQKMGDTLYGKCFVCDLPITVSSFECAHIISDKDNGEMTIENMDVTCTTCNRSCGKMNLHEYKNLFPKDYYIKNNTEDIQLNKIDSNFKILESLNKKINIMFITMCISITISAITLGIVVSY